MYAIMTESIFYYSLSVSVTHPLNPLRINVGFVVRQPISYSRDFHFEVGTLHFEPDLDLYQFNGVAKVFRTPQGLLVQGHFQAVISVQCVRCLVDTQQPLMAEFSELYAFSSHVMSETDLILREDGNLDLGPIVREYMVIEIPINPVCKPDCKGLCTICGEDLNVNNCEHQSLGSANVVIHDND
jgi:uncharacterized protein